MDPIKAKEKFSSNLMCPDQAQFSTTVLYMVYKTIEANNNITLNQLRYTLCNEYMLKEDAVAGAVASLTSRSLFNCVGRWSPRQAGNQPYDAANQRIHLRVRNDDEFSSWLANALGENPELEVFQPPAFNKRDGTPSKELPSTREVVTN